jgi:hypothetical protein
VHRSLGEQDQDGGTDITSATAPAVATAASAARAGAEARTKAGAEATRAEPAAEAPAETRSERTVMPAVAGAVGMHQVAKFAAALPALLVNGAAVRRRETEG